MFRDQYRLLTSLGFEVKVTPLSALNKNSVYTGVCLTEVDLMKSFSLEIFCTLVVAFSWFRLYVREKKLVALKNTPRYKFIRLMELEEPKQEEDKTAGVGSIGISTQQ